MKKYKPFKMWGPWIGVTILSYKSILNLIQFSLDNTIIERWIEEGMKLTDGGLVFFLALLSGTNGNIANLIYLALIISIIVSATIGFLIGWGIEFLLRKNKLFGLK